jgi:hypothetical protein
VRVHYSHLEEIFGAARRTVSHEVVAVIALNREIDLQFRFFAPGRTPIEIAQLRSRQRLIELGFVYAFGR